MTLLRLQEVRSGELHLRSGEYDQRGFLGRNEFDPLSKLMNAFASVSNFACLTGLQLRAPSSHLHLGC